MRLKYKFKGKNYYFLDSENISVSGLVEALSVLPVKENNALVICFNKKVNYDVSHMMVLKEKFEEVIYEEIVWSSPNALDFHILAKAGVIANSKRVQSIWFISKDKGYLPGIEVLRKTYPKIIFKLGPQNISDSENMFRNVLKQKISASSQIKSPDSTKYIAEVLTLFRQTKTYDSFKELREEINCKYGLSPFFLPELNEQFKILKKYESDPFL